jgi:hypothetical protein
MSLAHYIFLYFFIDPQNHRGAIASYEQNFIIISRMLTL